METTMLDAALSQGIWAVVAVFLLIYVVKSNEQRGKKQVIYALSDFLIMILSWLVKQSLRAFCFRRYSHEK